VRERVGGDDLNAVYRFDLDSTPDADKILALLRREIKKHNEYVNLLFHLFANGKHPNDIDFNSEEERDSDDWDWGENNADLAESSYMGELGDEYNEYETIQELRSWTDEIESIGKWERLDSDEQIDEPCVHLLRFFTKS